MDDAGAPILVEPVRVQRSSKICERSSVSRSLDAIERYGLEPEAIDGAILAAINVGLCLESDGDDRVAEGFNVDLAINGRAFPRR